MNEPQQAFIHLQEMRRSKVNLSDEVYVVNYNVLINIFCKLSRHKDAMLVFNDMIAEGLKPNIVTYNTLVFLSLFSLLHSLFSPSPFGSYYSD